MIASTLKYLSFSLLIFFVGTTVIPFEVILDEFNGELVMFQDYEEPGEEKEEKKEKEERLEGDPYISSIWNLKNSNQGQQNLYWGNESYEKLFYLSVPFPPPEQAKT